MNTETTKQKRNPNFDNGVLRADGCMNRYSQSRQMEFRTPEEDLSEFSFGRSAEWEEKKLINNVYKLKALGVNLKAGQTLEEFVEEHRALIEEEV